MEFTMFAAFKRSAEYEIESLNNKLAQAVEERNRAVAYCNELWKRLNSVMSLTAAAAANGGASAEHLHGALVISLPSSSPDSLDSTHHSKPPSPLSKWHTNATSVAPTNFSTGARNASLSSTTSSSSSLSTASTASSLGSLDLKNARIDGNTAGSITNGNSKQQVTNGLNGNTHSKVGTRRARHLQLVQHQQPQQQPQPQQLKQQKQQQQQQPDLNKSDDINGRQRNGTTSVGAGAPQFEGQNALHQLNGTCNGTSNGTSNDTGNTTTNGTNGKDVAISALGSMIPLNLKHSAATSIIDKNNNHPLIAEVRKVTAVGEIEETSPGQFKCRFCEKTFDRIFSVHRHERVHTGFKPCVCKACGRGFSEKRNLRHHIIRFHSDGSGRELLKRNRTRKTHSLNSSIASNNSNSHQQQAQAQQQRPNDGRNGSPFGALDCSGFSPMMHGLSVMAAAAEAKRKLDAVGTAQSMDDDFDDNNNHEQPMSDDDDDDNDIDCKHQLSIDEHQDQAPIGQDNNNNNDNNNNHNSKNKNKKIKTNNNDHRSDSVSSTHDDEDEETAGAESSQLRTIVISSSSSRRRKGKPSKKI